MLAYEYCLLAVAGAAAGFINVIAGGGSLLSVPALLFLGFEGPAANGTNRISIVVQSLTASIAFLKSGAQNFRESILLSLCLVPGSILRCDLGNTNRRRLVQPLTGRGNALGSGGHRNRE